jgi:hypothetical protein
MVWNLDSLFRFHFWVTLVLAPSYLLMTWLRFSVTRGVTPVTRNLSSLHRVPAFWALSPKKRIRVLTTKAGRRRAGPQAGRRWSSPGQLSGRWWLEAGWRRLGPQAGRWWPEPGQLLGRWANAARSDGREGLCSISFGFGRFRSVYWRYRPIYHDSVWYIEDIERFITILFGFLICFLNFEIWI